jgi:hypothetical protein
MDAAKPVMYIRFMHCKFLIPAAILFTGGLNAQEPPGTRQLVQQAFASIENVLAQCQSVEFQSVHQATETDLYRQIYSKYDKNAGATGGRTAEEHFQGRGDKYLYSEALTEFDGSGVRIEDLAYDGKYYQVLNHHLMSLAFSRFDPDNNHLSFGILNPFEMFGFLLPQVPGTMPSIRWTTVKNMKAWNICFAAAQYVEPTVYKNKTCIVVKIPCVLDNWIAKGPCAYIVYFSVRDAFFPLAWKLQNQSGRVIADYEIDEFGKAPVGKDGATFFYYPKKATRNGYAEDPKYPADAPETIVITETKLFQLNTVNDDTIFTIDPVKAKAKETLDYDRNIVTRVSPQP